MSTTETQNSHTAGPVVSPGAGVEHTGPAKARPLLALLPHIMRYRGLLAAGLAALMIAAGATLAIPLAARRIIDHGFSAENSGFIDQYFGVMLLVAVILAASSGARYFFITCIGERLAADMRTRVFTHILSLSATFYDRERTGELMSRLTADTTVLKSVFGSTVSVALRNLVMLAGALVMMVITSASLSALVLAALPLIVLPLVIMGRRVKGLSREAQDALARSAAHAQEALGAVLAVQAFGQEHRISKRFSMATEQAFKAAQMRVKMRAMLTTSIIFLAAGSTVMITWYGAQEVLSGRLSGGSLGQFVLYSVLAAGAMGQLSEVWGEIRLASGAAERLQELLDTPIEISAPETCVALPARASLSVRFAKVVFNYPTRPGDATLNSLSFHANAGETVAIVGPSGAGKSTVFNLLLRYYDPVSGTVELGGVDIARTDPARLRERLAMVPQETAIFSLSIADNIRFGRPDATREQVLAAARAAHVDVFAEKFPQGFDTEVGERGVRLSGGQRQRIAIARAILRDAPVLLLDEATSALDAQSEHLVQEALTRLMAGRTTLVIAHRLATVRGADRIVVLDGGRVVGEGDHDTLSRQDGLYRQLCELQFANGPSA